MRSHRLFRDLATDDQLEEALTASESAPVVIFKHSAICMTSSRAHRRIEDLADDVASIYRLVVQESRALSNRIARRFGIRHESPQVIVLANRQPVFNTSHGSITADLLQTIVNDHRRDAP